MTKRILLVLGRGTTDTECKDCGSQTIGAKPDERRCGTFNAVVHDGLRVFDCRSAEEMGDAASRLVQAIFDVSDCRGMESYRMNRR